MADGAMSESMPPGAFNGQRGSAACRKFEPLQRKSEASNACMW
jgi:hypothetical protein